MIRSTKPRLAALVCAVAFAGSALAQTAPRPAKPAAAAARPAAEGKTLSLGSGSGSGKLLTRDELRACLKRQESLAGRRNEAEAGRVALEGEKTALMQEQEAIKGERAKVDVARDQVAELNVRFKAYAERVEKFNGKVKEVGDATGLTADRRRRELDVERAELAKAQTDLDAEKARIGDSASQAVAAFNTRATALDQRASDWNKRNAEQTDRARAVNADRESWADECSNRRYREDDEIAIRRGE